MAKLRRDLPVDDLAARHAAGESLRSLAAAYGTTVHTLSRHLDRAGYKVRSRSDANIAENLKRPRGLGSRGGQKTSDNRYPYIKALRAKKAAMVSEYKNSRGCERCGETHPATLDLHHREERHPRLRRKINGRPHVGGDRWRDLSFVDLEAELKKCIVLCSN